MTRSIRRFAPRYSKHIILTRRFAPRTSSSAPPYPRGRPKLNPSFQLNLQNLPILPLHPHQINLHNKLRRNPTNLNLRVPQPSNFNQSRFNDEFLDGINFKNFRT